VFVTLKISVAKAIEKEGIPYTLIQNGVSFHSFFSISFSLSPIFCQPFYEYAFSPKLGFDFINGKTEILGDGNVPIRRTAMKDVAKAISIILRTPNPPKVKKKKKKKKKIKF